MTKAKYLVFKPRLSVLYSLSSYGLKPSIWYLNRRSIWCVVDGGRETKAKYLVFKHYLLKLGRQHHHPRLKPSIWHLNNIIPNVVISK